jgi:DNA mismatch endonuclease (patch repair protein)
VIDRSAIMRAVKSTNTKPELIVRKLAHALGFRFRLHGALPGKPDLVFAGRRKVIFVHGCFWHGHACARGARVPVNNRDYWVGKVARNRTRDRKTLRRLRADDWQVLVVWECETKNKEKLGSRLRRFLNAS